MLKDMLEMIWGDEIGSSKKHCQKFSDEYVRGYKHGLQVQAASAIKDVEQWVETVINPRIDAKNAEIAMLRERLAKYEGENNEQR